LTKVEISKG